MSFTGMGMTSTALEFVCEPGLGVPHFLKMYLIYAIGFGCVSSEILGRKNRYLGTLS